MTSSTELVDDVVAALEAGEVVLLPTDTVYGLAADPTSPAAMAELYDMKDRPAGMPIAVLVADEAQAGTLVEPTDAFHTLASRWPGALTLVAPIRPGVALHVSTTGSLGVRVPDSELVRAVARTFGPIAATSANRHGDQPVTTAAAAREIWQDRALRVIDGGRLNGRASTVVDVTGDVPAVLRQGDVDIDERPDPACQHGRRSPEPEGHTP